jgi:hypothetical protein
VVWREIPRHIAFSYHRAERLSATEWHYNAIVSLNEAFNRWLNMTALYGLFLPSFLKVLIDWVGKREVAFYPFGNLFRGVDYGDIA